VNDVKIRRLVWAGHMIRMEEERIPKKFLNEKFQNTRSVGKPSTRWENAVRRDSLHILGIRGWRRRIEDREERRRLLSEATA
jgi:hypothetical protein